MVKDFYVKDAIRFDNVTITSFFRIAQIQVRERQGGGGQYLALTLSDQTGALEARMWEEFTSAFESCGEGCYVKVQGLINQYKGRFQITINKMRSASSEEVDPSDFVPVSQFPVEEMDAELRGYVSAFTNADLQRLVLSFLDDPEIGPQFREAPAATKLHHAFRHGLLEHVLCLVRVLLATAKFYPEVDPDLLVTGAILHDIGKVRELEWASTFRYSLEGQMIGHISIAQGMLREKVRELAPFPERLRVLIEHMILSHHGRLEFGSPKLPMTPEALLLSALDDLEAKFAAMRREFRSAEESGKKPDEVTEWVRSMERPLLNSEAYLRAVKTLKSAESAPLQPELRLEPSLDLEPEPARES